MIYFKKTRRALCFAIAAIVLFPSLQSHAGISPLAREIQVREIRVRLTNRQLGLQVDVASEAPLITQYSLPPEKERQAIELARAGRRIFLGRISHRDDCSLASPPLRLGREVSRLGRTR